MKKTRLWMLNILTLCLLASCQNEEIQNEVDNSANTPSTKQLAKLKSLGVNTENVSIKNIEDLDGTSQNYLVNDTDLAIPVNGLFSLESLEDMDNGMKQYRTYNLVTGANRTIDVLGYTGGGGFGLSSTGRTALQQAVNNYNALGTSLRMRLTFGTNYQAADLVVYVRSDLGAGGLAGFPSGGRPYKWARIGPNVKNNGLAYTRHVITHEMGHCIGLRHTDWFARVCNGGANEGQGSDGAIHIPGTPTGIDINSYMISCPAPGTTPAGNFSAGDVAALNYLY